MSTRLVILGLLRERPLYGYELKHIIEEHMGDWTNIAFGSIYFALNKLADEGYIAKIAVEQEGNRPSRSIYQVTEAGQGEFLRLLREAWGNIEREYYQIDIALTFSEALSKDEILAFLQGRVDVLEGILKHVEGHRNERAADEEVPRLAAAVFDHNLAHFRAELDWTRDLLHKFEQGVYP